MMIANEREYRITKAARRRFEDAIGKYKPGPEVDSRMGKIMDDAWQSEVEVLTEQIERYEDLRAGHVEHRGIESLKDIPTALIEARIAAGLTQKNLAERLDLKPQQIQRWEAGRYDSVCHGRLWEIAEALDMRIAGTADYTCLAERLASRVAPPEAKAA